VTERGRKIGRGGEIQTKLRDGHTWREFKRGREIDMKR